MEKKQYREEKYGEETIQTNARKETLANSYIK